MKKTIGWLFSAAILLAASLHTYADSAVQVTADAAGLTPVDGTTLSGPGTFWVLQAGANGQVASIPFPFLPPDDSSLPIYLVTNNLYLVDETGGALASPSFMSRHSMASSALVTTQVQAVADLIELLQNYTNNDSGSNQPYGAGQIIDTNGLWLEIVEYNPNDTNLLMVLHGTSDTNLFQLNSATNLLSTNWNVGQLTWGDPGSDETLLDPVPRTAPQTFYRAHHANAIMQVWDVMDSMELNATNSNGHIGIIGLQDGVEPLPTNDINVYYTLSGTATNGIDYTNLPGMLTILAGMQDTNIIIQPTAMGLAPDKTIVLTLLQNSNYLIDPDYLFTTNILHGNPELIPVAFGDTEFPCPNNSVTNDLSLRAGDPLGQPLTFSIVSLPTHGTLETNLLPLVMYTPNSCFEGSDSFIFTASNGQYTSAPATVTFIISDPILGVSPVSVETSAGQSISFNLNGSDSCGEGVNFMLTAPAHGSLNTNSLPTVTYTSTDTNFSGIESLNYIVTSGCGGDAVTSSVTIFVAGGPILSLGCDPFENGTYIPLEWFLGTNETQMFQQLGGLDDYKIYHSTVSGGPYTCIGTNFTSLSQSTFEDTNAVAGQTNYYVVAFDFTFGSFAFESPFSHEIQAVPIYNFINADATWDVWQIFTNGSPSTWLGDFQAPFSDQFPNQYSGALPLPNSPWTSVTMRSNNIALVLPVDWTNETQLARVKYAIAIDNDYWLYLNHSTTFIDTTNHNSEASWTGLKSFEDVAPGLLHGGTNVVSVVTRDRDLGQKNYFSMVVTTNDCSQ